MPLPTDTLLAQQWHLGNPTAGLRDLNVRRAWNPGQGAEYTGAGTRVVVVDDGFDYNHADLAAPHNEALDFDYRDNDFDSFGLNSDNHGTAVMGIIGADNNGTGVVGVAFDAELVGYRTANTISDAWLQDIRDAIDDAAGVAAADVVNISQNFSNANAFFGDGFNALRFDEIEASIQFATSNGRGGLGTTVVHSAGNNRTDNFDVNADDWSNDTREVIVAGVEQNGFVTSTSSFGAALLVSAFSTNPAQVLTTDRSGAGAGYNNSTVGNDFAVFDGTSAATPMVAGIVALMYDAEPGLGWRDVQDILASSARHTGPAIVPFGTWGWNGATSWNGGGHHFSADYGYGLVDGTAAVRLAESWLATGRAAERSANEVLFSYDRINSPFTLPVGSTTLGIPVGDFTNIEIERVTVTLAASIPRTGEFGLFLTSPSGTVSELIDGVGGGTSYNGTWTFESQAFRGERAVGNWSVRLLDTVAANPITITDLVLNHYGSAEGSNRYIYTDEYATYAGVGNHSTEIRDLNGGGRDEINTTAVTSGSTISLRPGTFGVIAGQLHSVAFENIENAQGGDGNDFILGNTLNNHLLGWRGNDNLQGNAGNDTLNGGSGNDILNGGADNDVLLAGEGDNVGFGEDGNDSLYGGLGRDTFDGGPGNDLLSGGDGDNLLTGGAGNDTFSAENGRDTMRGGGGNDTLQGGQGDDLIEGGPGQDTAFFLAFPSSSTLTRNPDSSWSVTTVPGIGPPTVDRLVDTELVTFFFTTVRIRETTETDLFADSSSDILWRNNDGSVRAWDQAGATIAAINALPSVGLEWRVDGKGDFNDDGTSDLLFRNTGTGQAVIWTLQDGAYAGAGSLGTVGLEWQIAGTADFDLDSDHDILWRNLSSGDVHVWTLENGAYAAGATIANVGLDWSIVGTGDFGGDGRADALWRNTASGEVVIWELDGAAYAGGGSLGAVGLDWRIDETGDFGGDGTSDILWRNTNSGEVIVWQLDGATVTAFGSVGTVGLDWAINEVGDYGGDGRADILWRNATSGEAVIWELNGSTYIGGGSVSTVGNDWFIA